MTDAESKARKVKLEEQLNKQREDLDETVRDHVYNIQIKGLDKLVENLEEDVENQVYEMSKNLENVSSKISELTNGVELSNDIMTKIISYLNANNVKDDNGKVVASIANTYAKGTNFHAGGPAFINEGGSAEMIQLPDGTILMPYAPKGMKVMSAEATRKAFAASTLPISNVGLKDLGMGNITSQRMTSGDTVINSAINIDGNVDHHTFDELKSYIESKAYKTAMTNYAVKEISRDARMSGRKVGF